MPNSNEKKDAEGVKRPSPVLDTSRAGRPHIPSDGITFESSSPAPPQDDLIVEVELAAGTTDLREELITNTAGFMAADLTNGSTASDSSFAAVLRSYGLLEARPVFTREQIEREEAWPNTIGEEPLSDRLSRNERLSALSSFVRLRFPRGTSPREVVDSLRQLPHVIRAVAVPRAAPPRPHDSLAGVAMVLIGPVPSDPLIGADDTSIAPDQEGLERQWYLHRTRAPQAWAFARGAGVVIADIDWGFFTAHLDLEPGIKLTFNAVDETDHVTEGPGVAHGTAVLAIAGARSDSYGISGYAPESDLWAIQADSAVNPAPVSFREPWAEAIDFVRRTNAGTRRKVIILETQAEGGGNYEQVPAVNAAIRAAIADGCIVCVAAGNGNRPAHLTDAGDDFEQTGSILVGATNYHPDKNERAPFSNYGKWVIVSAPGDSLHDLTCGIETNYAYRNDFGGTSGATPKVAGTIALMLSVNPKLSNDEIREILTTTGSPTVTDDPEKQIGVFLNAEAAVAEALRRRDGTT